MQVVLENEWICAKINTFGAELASLVNKENGEEYIWNADPAYWKRHAPVLFPFVGSLRNKEYRYDGKTYEMGQHGFARDMEFEMLRAEKTEAWFALQASEETLAKYPFAFRLEIGYKLEKKVVQVYWRVINQDTKKMYFSIGGHPAFMCPIGGEGKQTDYFITFDTDKDLPYSKLDANGLVYSRDNLLKTEKGVLAIDAHLFDEDALVIEKDQAHEVSLSRANGKPYLTVRFDAPLFGLWSPAKKNAPFVCIEPWYGRCDAADFDGDLTQREYGHALDTGADFRTVFSIEIA